MKSEWLFRSGNFIPVVSTINYRLSVGDLYHHCEYKVDGFSTHFDIPNSNNLISLAFECINPKAISVTCTSNIKMKGSFASCVVALATITCALPREWP